MKGAPARRLVQLAPLVERLVIVVMDVRAEARFILHQDPGELALDDGRRRFELRQPRELVALVELDVRQPRVCVLHGLLPVSFARPERRVDERLEPFLLRAGKRVTGVADVFADVAGELADVVRMDLARARDGLARRRVELGIGRRLDQRDAVGNGRVLRPPELVEQRRLHQERREIAVVDGERLAQRRECALDVAQLPPHDGEVEPQAQVAAMARERALQGGPGRWHVAGRHRLQGGLVRAHRLVVHAAVSIIPAAMATPAAPANAAALLELARACRERGDVAGEIQALESLLADGAAAHSGAGSARRSLCRCGRRALRIFLLSHGPSFGTGDRRLEGNRHPARARERGLRPVRDRLPRLSPAEPRRQGLRRGEVEPALRAVGRPDPRPEAHLPAAAEVLLLPGPAAGPVLRTEPLSLVRRCRGGTA